METVLPIVSTKLAQVRRKHSAVAAGTATAAGVGAAVVMLAIEMLTDWLVPLPDGLPLTMRIAFLAFLLAAVGYLIFRYGIAPVVFGPDDEQIALWVESEEPDFRSRLISAVQFARQGMLSSGGVSAVLVQAMLAETEVYAREKEFARVIKTDRLLRLGSAAGLALLLGLTGLALGGPAGGDLLKRALLVPGVEVPRKTRVEVLEPNKIVARGDEVMIAALAHGIQPREGRLTLYYASGAKQSFTMPHDPDHPEQYARKILNVQEPFTYVVRLNDAISQEYRVDAQLRPAVSFLECVQHYPSYTGLAAVRRSPGDLSLLAGSRLALRITANKPVRAVESVQVEDGNYVLLVGSDGGEAYRDQKWPLSVDPADHTRLVTRQGALDSIPLPQGTTGFSVYLLDEHGLRSRDPAIYRIDLNPDQPPKIRITFPERKEELVTPIASIPISYDAADDFALGKIVLKYKLAPVETTEIRAEEGKPIEAPQGLPASLPAAQVQSVDLPLDGQPRSRRDTYSWKLAELRPPLNYLIEWWLEAQDTNDLTGPGVVASEHFQARVVSEEEKRRDLFNRLETNWEQINTLNQGEEDLADRMRQGLKK